MKGSLPEDDDAASVFVNIVREAATNAAKHAQAKHVDVNISRIGNVTLLRVVNDGMPAPGEFAHGLRHSWHAPRGGSHWRHVRRLLK